MIRVLTVFVFLLSQITATAQNNDEEERDNDTASAAADTTSPDTAEREVRYWSIVSNNSLNFSQVSLTNWQAGGSNSLGGNLMVNFTANYKRGNWGWANLVNVLYGINKQGDLTIKTDDRFEWNTRLDRNVSERWSVSLNGNVRTQFARGYDSVDDEKDEYISDFLSPLYSILGIGMTYQPDDELSVFISPLTYRNTLVLDQKLANEGTYGLEPAEIGPDGRFVLDSKHTRSELGGFVNVIWQTELMKNISYQTKIDLYSNYLNDHPQNIDVNWENYLFLKVNKLISVNLNTHLIYDEDVLIAYDSNGDGEMDARGPRTQFKQVLGLGVTFKFKRERDPKEDEKGDE